MPNICSYGMLVTGKRDNVNEFINIMKAGYKCVPKDPRHMWRVFEAEDNLENEYENDIISATIYGNCAWSVLTSMTLDGYQANRTVEEANNGTTLEIETGRLNLVTEVFSEESGMEFMEHYVVAFGNVETMECIDYSEYYIEDYDNVEEFNEVTGESWTEQEFEDYGDDIYTTGGIEWEFSNGYTLFNEYYNINSSEEEPNIEEISEEELLNILNTL